MKKRYILAGLLLSGLVVSSATACGKDDVPEVKETFEFKGISSESTAKLEYNVGEFVDVSDIVLKAIYTSSKTGLDSTNTVTNFTISVKDASGNVVTRFDSVGTYTLTVTFEGETKDFTINVTKKEFDNVSDAISYAEAKDSFVNGGTASVKYIYSADPNAEPGYEESQSFTLGNDFMVTNSGEGEYTQQVVYSLDKKQNAFAVLINGTGDNKTVSKFNYDVEKENVKGVAADIFGEGTNDGYGAADIVKNLSEYGKEYGFDYKSDVNTVEGKKVYSYSFKSIETLWGTDYAFNISVEFTLGLFGNIENAKITETKYFDAVISDDKTSFTLPELADGEVYEGQSRIFEMTQTVGAKATDNEYLYSHLAVENFKVMNGETEIVDGDVINVDLDNGNFEVDGLHRQQYKFTISDYTPTTANPELDKIVVTLKGTAFDGTEVSQSSEDWNWDYNYVNVYNETITFYAAGNYTVTFSSGTTTKTITINVAPETPNEIGIKTYENLNEKSDFVDSKGAYTIYKSNVLYLAPSIAAKLDQACIVSLANGTTGAKLEEETVKDVKAYKFTATEAGTYTVTFAAKEDTTVTNTITITVLENPDVADMLEGTYYTLIGDNIATVVFGTDGRVTTTVGEQSQSFAFRYENNEIVLTDPEGDSLNYNIVVNAKYELQLVDADSNKYTLSTEVPTTTEFELAGEYSVSLMNGMITYTLTFAATNATTGVMTLNTGSKTGKYDYVYTPATGEIALTVQASSSDYLGTATVEVVNDALVYNFNGTAYTCTKTSGESTGGDEEGIYPSAFIGTWESAYGTVIVITADSITMDGTAVSNIAYDGEKISFDYFGFESWIMFNNADNTEILDDMDNVFTKQGSTDDSNSIPQDFVGTWADPQDASSTVVITANSIQYLGEDISSYEYTDGRLLFRSTRWGAIALELSADKTTITDSYVTYEKQSSTGDDEGIYPSAFIGTWESAYGTVLVITADSITMDGIAVSNIAYDGEKITFTSGSFDCWIKFNNADNTEILDDMDNVFTKQGSTDDSNSIPEDFVGTWADPQDASSTIVITANSIQYLGEDISAYEYTDGRLLFRSTRWGAIALELSADKTTISDSVSNYAKKVA